MSAFALVSAMISHRYQYLDGLPQLELYHYSSYAFTKKDVYQAEFWYLR